MTWNISEVLKMTSKFLGFVKNIKRLYLIPSSSSCKLGLSPGARKASASAQLNQMAEQKREIKILQGYTVPKDGLCNLESWVHLSCECGQVAGPL